MPLDRLPKDQNTKTEAGRETSFIVFARQNHHIKGIVRIHHPFHIGSSLYFIETLLKDRKYIYATGSTSKRSKYQNYSRQRNFLRRIF